MRYSGRCLPYFPGSGWKSQKLLKSLQRNKFSIVHQTVGGEKMWKSRKTSQKPKDFLRSFELGREGRWHGVWSKRPLILLKCNPSCNRRKWTNKMKQFCSGKVLVLFHRSLYRALNLTYPWNIGGLSYDGTIETEMGQGSAGETVDILTTTVFKPVSQP